MNGGMLLLSILAIIAVILVAAAVIAVIGNMIIGAFDNKKANTEDKTQEYQSLNTYNNQVQNQVNNDYDFETINKAKEEQEKALSEPDAEEDFDIDDEDADLEEIENNLKNKNAQVEEDEEDLDDLDDLLDDISNEVVEDEKNKEAETQVATSKELEKYNIGTYLDENNEENEENEEEPANEPVPVIVDRSEEIEALKAQLALANQQLEEARNTKNINGDVSIDMTEEACLERLAVLEERLKSAKADYKINMKEYRPIKKVMNDLDRYETKLRRKEASLANKKIALYGVNKYVDIDKEHAEKVLNESELVDGLRLSVQHCEEVIAANKDRFPILEHTNKILTENIANLEQDIGNTKQMLQKIRDKKGNDGEGNNGEGENE